MAEAAALAGYGPSGSPALAFTLAGQQPPSEAMRRILDGLRRKLEKHGHQFRAGAEEGVGFVMHVVDAAEAPLVSPAQPGGVRPGRDRSAGEAQPRAARGVPAADPQPQQPAAVHRQRRAAGGDPFRHPGAGRVFGRRRPARGELLRSAVPAGGAAGLQPPGHQQHL